MKEAPTTKVAYRDVQRGVRIQKEEEEEERNPAGFPPLRGPPARGGRRRRKEEGAITGWGTKGKEWEGGKCDTTVSSFVWRRFSFLPLRGFGAAGSG